MTRWDELLATPGAILADGAMGSALMAQGLELGAAPELWNVTHPERVGAVHAGYAAAGSRIILTNSFGASRFRLERHGLADRLDELNRAAVAVARAAAPGALIAGDIGPSGLMLAPLGPLSVAEAREGFAAQARALVAGGADLIWIETMADLAEVAAAVTGVQDVAPGLPVIATMTFDTKGRTMMGVRPEQAVKELTRLGVSALGANCGNGPDEMLEVIGRMVAVAPSVPVVAKANAGMPRLVEGRAVYDAGPEVMARYALAARDRGARIIGACCGSTPAHLAAMGAALGAGPA
ncbi:MAG: homocysteine S-methyltransferase family protein [Gemmatimonadetes bacterium]|nr:homocysteine S-methyltransferase family protein [Gemmatimonadota bacterium]